MVHYKDLTNKHQQNSACDITLLASIATFAAIVSMKMDISPLNCCLMCLGRNDPTLSLVLNFVTYLPAKCDEHSL